MMKKKLTARQPLPFLSIATLNLILMSECLLQLIAPFRDAVSTKKQMESLVGLAAVAWNLAISSGEDKAKLLSGLPSNISENEILSKLIERKKELYPDDLRRPIHFTVESREDTWYVEVKSAILPKV